MDSPWLTIPEACAYSKHAQRTLRRYIAQGRLHAGGRGKLLIHKDHLDRQIEQGFPLLGVQGESKPKSRRQKPTRVVLR